MADTIAQWDKEHRNFSRLLDAFESQLTALRGDGEPDYEAMLDIMDYLTSYSDRVHHPMEDLIFAKAVERDPAIRPAVVELAKQHISMAQSGKDLRARLQGIFDGRVESRDAIAHACAGYIAAFRRHMDKEYQELFQPARKLLTPKDWAEIEAQGSSDQTDPLTEQRLDQQYASLKKLLE